MYFVQRVQPPAAAWRWSLSFLLDFSCIVGVQSPVFVLLMEAGEEIQKTKFRAEEDPSRMKRSIAVDLNLLPVL